MFKSINWPPGKSRFSMYVCTCYVSSSVLWTVLWLNFLFVLDICDSDSSLNSLQPKNNYYTDKPVHSHRLYNILYFMHTQSWCLEQYTSKKLKKGFIQNLKNGTSVIDLTVCNNYSTPFTFGMCRLTIWTRDI